MNFDRYEYQIINEYIVALINSDISGLDDNEIEQVENFERYLNNQYGLGKWHLDVDTDSEPYFANCDICNMHGSVYDVNVMVQTD